jgi:hypothetical protein
MGKQYVEYGLKLQSLWNDRLNRDFQRLPYYLIGKTVNKLHIS